MRLLSTIVLAALAVIATLTQAAANEAGEALYGSCASCHGAQAEGNKTLNAPRLNHLQPVYVVAQLQKFNSGLRGGEGATAAAMQMAGMAAVLADEQAMQDVALYISSLASTAAAASVQGDVQLGGDYYNQFCGACHGGDAGGNPALNSPRLVGSDDWYLLAQLQAFRSGQRGAHPDDKTGRQMRAMAGVLPDEQAINAVIAFIQSLPE